MWLLSDFRGQARGSSKTGGTEAHDVAMQQAEDVLNRTDL